MIRKSGFFNILMILFVTICLPGFASGGPIEDLQPGHWLELTDLLQNHIYDVAPDPPIACGMGSGPKAVIRAYSGGAYDSKRDKFIAWGGGHGDYCGNEIYALDINTLKWSRIFGPSPNIPTGEAPFETYNDDPLEPGSRHTYDGLEYIPPPVDRFFSEGGSLWRIASRSSATYFFDFDTLTWERKSNAPNTEQGINTAYDPVTGHIFHRGKESFNEYDPISDTWTDLTGFDDNANAVHSENTGAFDPNTREFVIIGGNQTPQQFAFNVDTKESRKLDTRGINNIVGARSPGLEYDPVLKKIVGWGGGASVYSLDTTTWEWTEHPPAPDNTVIPEIPPYDYTCIKVPSGGTFGRFRYIPSKNIYILVTWLKVKTSSGSCDSYFSAEGFERVYIYKLSEGGGTPPDTTPPTIPQGLDTNPMSGSQIDLSWQASTDAESGITSYKIYRDNVEVGTSSSTSYLDTNLTEGTTYSYQVSAISIGGESDKSTSVSATTLSDITPPNIISVSSTGDPFKVTIMFSEPVEQASATTASNYNIDNNITVSGVSLGADLKTATLTTSEHSEGINYTLTVNSINDRANIPNTVLPDTQRTYTFTASFLISNLSVTSGKNYVWVTLDVGKQPYIDRSFTFSTVPSAYIGLNYLKTANDDKGGTDNPFITFDVNQSVTVYVAHSAYITPKPSWLLSWIDTSEDLVTSDTTLHLYKKDFAAGTVTLGGNEGGSVSMYSVVVKSASGTIDATTPSPPQGLRKTN